METLESALEIAKSTWHNISENQNPPCVQDSYLGEEHLVVIEAKVFNNSDAYEKPGT